MQKEMPAYNVVRHQRNQNRHQWQRFCFEEEQLRKKYGDTLPNVRQSWFGSAETSPSQVALQCTVVSIYTHHARMLVCVRTHTHSHARMHVHTHTHTHTHTHASAHACTNIHTDAHIAKHRHTRTVLVLAPLP